MELTPVRKYDCEPTDDGRITVLVPKYTDKIFGAILQPRIKDKYIKANMDDYGSAVWLMIDGKTNVYEISKMMLDEFGEDIQPVYERISLFISNLYRNGFINFNEIIEGKTNGKKIS